VQQTIAYYFIKPSSNFITQWNSALLPQKSEC